MGLSSRAFASHALSCAARLNLVHFCSPPSIGICSAMASAQAPSFCPPNSSIRFYAPPVLRPVAQHFRKLGFRAAQESLVSTLSHEKGLCNCGSWKEVQKWTIARAFESSAYEALRLCEWGAREASRIPQEIVYSGYIAKSFSCRDICNRLISSISRRSGQNEVCRNT